ncbi:UvrD-helicase domain-containing protein [Pelomonas sp. UHG3]|uniref:UvrD-helicase domain-containing protein n=1 Tax=Roseateles hydrophilus TaxID=2975054 RepID=A0ACC6CDB1_9BURK|nr:UvrD-helicase domain-containing protein [Pelomonas sp. UHG3]MCY4746342.1 UvrD-helicase domain-containing protein [Pelomonas sp. UHG3]
MTSNFAYYADGRLIPRERFYAIACDPARSSIVEACAGAGKTWMLVSRILRALLAGAEPQQIVAITFTRKAAGEMRERLSEWLAGFAAADEAVQRQALIDRGVDAAEAERLRPRLATLHGELLRGGRGVEVRTFHGWFSQLLRAAPMSLLADLGISPELQLIEDEAELMPPLWRRFHGVVLSDAELLADFQALTLARGRHNLREWLLAAFSKRVELGLADATGVLQASLLPPKQDPAERFELLAPSLVTVARELGQGGAKAQTAAAALVDAGSFDEVWKALFTATGTPRKFDKATDALPSLRAVFVELEGLRADFDQLAAAEQHARMCRLARVLVTEFDALKRGRGLVDMNDLERGALALLARPELAGWVQQRLDAQVRHLLIDEFQDTSPLQWQALHGWLQAYAGAGGGAQISVFIVGDPKQSIYRFRRAEPRVFIAAREFVLGGLGGVSLACDHTRRNAPEVLAAVNGALDGVLDGFRPHTTEGTPGSDALAGLWLLDGPPGEKAERETDPLAWRSSLTEPRHEPEFERRAAEAQRVAACIAGLLAARPDLGPEDIFVLARKREPLRQLSAALTTAGIPHAAPEETPLADAPAVRDLLALLDVLASPGHDHSLAQALASPLFGIADDELLRIARAAGRVAYLDAPAAESPQPWWAAVQALADPSPALARARGLLAGWREAAALSTPHELLDRIVHEGELLPRVLAASPPTEAAARVQSVQALLRAALDLDGGRYAQLYGFVRALRSRPLTWAATAGGAGVQLLTIHGAKGLEAEVVILLDTEAAPPKAETYGLLLDWPVGDPAPTCAAFFGSEAKPPPSLAGLVAQEQAAREREEFNALYVALTRARRTLIVSRTPAKRPQASWWARLAPLGQPWPLPLLDGAAGAAPALHWWPLPAWQGQRVPLQARAADNARAAQVGEALHRALEWVSQPGQTQPLAVLLAGSSQAFGLDAAGRKQLEAAVRAILASAEARPFFDPAELLWAGNEVAVTLPSGEGRIDRLVQRRDGCWWVLDYKLGLTPEAQQAYHEQLRGYVAAVQLLQPGEPVKAALISGEGRVISVG